MAVKELTLTFSTPGAKAVSQTKGMEYNDRGFDKSTSMMKVVIVQQYQVNGCLVMRHVGDGDGFVKFNLEFWK
jgi:hypothetical protein